MQENDEKRITALLTAWFGALGTPEYDLPRRIWFEVDPAFDDCLRRDFLTDQQRAAAGAYDHWGEERDGALALVLLLDQLPRNLYRGTPAAFACDAKARDIARHALISGFDAQLPAVRRPFLYLPFEHSELLADQELSLRLFGALPMDADGMKKLRYAESHHRVIARFGRFPHRNAILGRVSTAAETQFLTEPGSSF